MEYTGYKIVISILFAVIIAFFIFIGIHSCEELIKKRRECVEICGNKKVKIIDRECYCHHIQVESNQ